MPWGLTEELSFNETYKSQWVIAVVFKLLPLLTGGDTGPTMSSFVGLTAKKTT